MIPDCQPLVRPLSGDEARALLARNCRGRIAYSFHGRVDIEPIQYVYDEPWIFGRTGLGARVLTLTHQPWCAVETDDVQDAHRWESVVVRGPFLVLDPVIDRAEFSQAVAALARLIPADAPPDADTLPRTAIFRVRASEIAGRCSAPHVAAEVFITP